MSGHRPIVLLAGRHRPHEQLLLAYSALVGGVYLADASEPAWSVVLHPWLFTVWAAALALSGLTGLAGCWWRGERGLGVELGGLLVNAGALLMYVASVFTYAGWRALFTGGLVAAWAGANLWRAGQVGKELRSIRGVR